MNNTVEIVMSKKSCSYLVIFCGTILALPVFLWVLWLISLLLEKNGGSWRQILRVLRPSLEDCNVLSSIRPVSNCYKKLKPAQAKANLYRSWHFALREGPISIAPAQTSQSKQRIICSLLIMVEQISTL